MVRAAGESHGGRAAAMRRRLDGVDLRQDHDRRGHRGLRRVHRLAGSARAGRRHPRPGPAGGGARSRRRPRHRARPQPPHTAERGRVAAQVHRGYRTGAVGHPGQGARRARAPLIRRPDARLGAALLVALRQLSRAATRSISARRRCGPGTTSPSWAARPSAAATRRSRRTSSRRAHRRSSGRWGTRTSTTRRSTRRCV